VNTLALHHLEAQGKKVYPQPHIIELIQDKRVQKQFYKQNGFPTAEFILTENAQDVAANAHFLPAFHKLGKEGYDGKGVVKISSLTDLDKAFDKPGLLEKLVQFEKEITVIVARNPQGAVSCYDAVELVYHEQNMVDYLLAPAQINIEIQQKAQVLATSIINSLGMVGILAVELFLTPSGALLINEIAPRPHNSGHHTIEACFCSQFTQHWRAILGLPLGNTALRSKAAMVNLIGHANYSGTAKYLGVESILEDPSAYLHLYGKAETRPHRKMGHFTILRPNFQELQNALLQLKNEVQVVAQ
jgi:5-(carboxyamino)imidazole ribonucleotide synthase